MKKRFIALILVSVLLLSFVSCSKSAYDSADIRDYDFAPMEAESYSAMDELSYGSTNGVAYKADYSSSYNETVKEPEKQNDLDSRKIIKNADLNFQTKEYDAFMTSLKDTINRFGGYIESSDIYDGGVTSYKYSRNANMKIRIPAAQYQPFMDTVTTLGSLTRSSEYISDVTLQYVDIESRISAYETEYNALMELLAKAESVDAIIQLRSHISDIQYQLETYKSQIRKYDDLISYCTVNIYVDEVRIEKVSEDKMTFGDRIREGLSETFINLKDDLADFAVWFIVNLPYIVIQLALIAVIIIVIVAISKKSKKKKAKKSKEIKSENEEKKN